MPATLNQGFHSLLGRLLDDIAGCHALVGHLTPDYLYYYRREVACCAVIAPHPISITPASAIALTPSAY